MNVKPLILAAALGLALNAHAAPKAKTVKNPSNPSLFRRPIPKPVLTAYI